MKPVIIAVLAVLVVTALLVLRRSPSRAGQIAAEAVVEAELISYGWSQDELTKILGDFSANYEMESLAGSSVALESDGSLRVDLSERLPANILLYLVNYVQYPRDFDLTSRSIVVAAKSKLSAGFNPPTASLIGKSVLIYVPTDDKAYDLVHIGVGQEHFAVPFTNHQWQKTDAARLPTKLLPLLEVDEQ